MIISYLIVEGVGRNPALVKIDKTEVNMAYVRAKSTNAYAHTYKHANLYVYNYVNIWKLYFLFL